MGASEYRNHHYVPQWYQRRFVEPGSQDGVLYYLHVRAPTIVDASGVRRAVPTGRRRPIRKCFAEEDLYTLRFGGLASTAIEQLLFGAIDNRGSKAVDYWASFRHPAVDQEALFDLLQFMSAQKLRTPKALQWLANQIPDPSPNAVLQAMVQLQNLYSTIWSESVWLLADARSSDTKLLVSDHPITIYNRACGPRDERCRGANDPDVRLHASQTIFPLDLETVLVLTNRSWARNPYQSATGVRPNPVLYRDSFFNFFDIQTHRSLDEEEVLQINFIIKSRAYQFIAAGRKDWLFPERHVSKSDWPHFGDGYLLMPDPRPLRPGAQVFLGYESGRSEAFDDYGLRPWQAGYGSHDQQRLDDDPLSRFQGEFARRFGPRRRGRSFSEGRIDPEVDSDDVHQHHLASERRDRSGPRSRPRRSR